MKQFLVVCCLFISCISAINTKKISLEDIERDNLRSEKRPRPVNAAPSPTQFGFVPVKTAQDYIQKIPKQQYVQPQYTVPQPIAGQGYDNTQKYISSAVAQAPQYPVAQYSPQQYATNQDVSGQQLYYGQQNQYENYGNVQYVTDNSIAQKQTDQYYPQQYVYLQQYPSSSTSIQSVVDPKGQLQYIMYIPSYVAAADQTQNYENVVYADQSQYTQETTAQQSTPEYVEEKKQTQYVPPLAVEEPRTQYISPREPKSLLDSYVPSILQIQYYKQQQQNLANALTQPPKTSQVITGKTNYVKTNYRSQRGHKHSRP